MGQVFSNKKNIFSAIFSSNSDEFSQAMNESLNVMHKKVFLLE